ncbi:MAG: ATP-binding protein [Bryobacter sp.]|jgi:hypothetical protein|nr:ATP-binding protein [Bryobacter sp. CoA8 C33]
MSSIATVDPKLLKLLNPEEAVDLFRDLLWAESWRQGINILDVSVPSNITAADGGVDAEVSAAPATTGLLSQGLTRYQIKTGDFSATQPAKIKELLCVDGSYDLKPRVEYCLKNNATFVVVLFGSDNPNQTEDDTTIDGCKELLKKHHPAIVNPKIKVIRGNHIAAELSMHVALSLRAQRIPSSPFRTHREWASQSDMIPPVEYGPAQEGIRAQLEGELRGRTRAIHVCLTGEPGAGKTRMVLEATRAQDLAPLVIYFPSPRQCTASGIVELLLHDQRRHAILVVDDTEVQEAQNLWNTLEHQGERIKLVTLQHEMPHVGGSTVVLSVAPLDEKQVFAILQQYVPGNQSQGFVPLCSGSPRVAHVIGGNLRSYPNDLLQAPDTVDVWGRYICGTDDPKGELVRERHILLRYCALFRKFGWKKPVAEELDTIIALIQKNHPTIDKGKVLAAIDGLRKRRILQGETTLYITPKALHIKLWGEWWELYGPHIDFAPFVDALPVTMRGWFYDMLRYARESGVATKLVNELLGPEGPFVKTSLLKSSSGAEVFNVLAEANPSRGLDCLDATIGKESIDALRENTDGRRHIVWALERMAMWRPLFTRSAKLLARLAVAENEPRISNNATGVFANLFSLGPGDVAPTEAPPEERFPLLAAMLTATDPVVRLLAIRACGIAFNYRNFVRTGGGDVQGLRLPPERWRPKTYGDWFAAYEQVWTLLRETLPNLSINEQAEATKLMIQHAFQLGQIPRLGPLVLATLGEIAAMGVNKQELADQLEFSIEHLDRFPEKDRPAWSQLLQRVHGGADFVGRLHRFVGRTAWRVDDETERAMIELAKEAQQDATLLDATLPWLLSAEAHNAHMFGYQLGKRDDEGKLWQQLFAQAVAAESRANLGLLGGYLRATKERNEKRWYEQLVECSTDEGVAAVLFHLIFQSGLNDDTGLLLVKVTKEGRSPALNLRQFVIGTEIRNLSEAVFTEWRGLLRSAGGNEMQALIELMDAYYTRSKPIRPVPLPDTVEILVDERLFAEGSRSSGMLTDHSWRELARAVVSQDPTQVPPLATVIFDHLGVESAVLQQFGDTGPTKWLREVAQQEPELLWPLVRERLGPPIDRRAFHLKHWIDNSHAFDQRQPNFLDTLPRQDLWEWVDADVERRAWYLAHLAAPILTPGSLARDVLIQYGEREDVQSNLRANFDTEGWSGPESSHYEGKRSAMGRLLDTETEPNVRNWLTKYIELLERRVERARVDEEREF